MGRRVADEMTTFFNSVSDLAGNPSDFTNRTNVIENAKNLTQSFRTVDTELTRQKADFEGNIGQKVLQVNDLTKEIAELNVRIRTMETGIGQQSNDLRDNRDMLVQDLSKIVDIHYYEDKDGMMMIRGPRETTMVDRGHAAKMSLMASAEDPSVSNIMISDQNDGNIKNITNDIRGGEMAGLVELRDKVVPDLLDKNNEMAYTFSTRFNQIHKEGYGVGKYASSTGRNFFEAPADMYSAARNLRIDDSVTQSQDAISVASTALAPADNVVANKLLNIKDEALLGEGNISLNEYYANFMGVLGLEVVRADHLHEANKILLADLEVRREAISGVSLDEEATNLLKWQSNFTASSKVITTVDEMLETVLSLKR